MADDDENKWTRPSNPSPAPILRRAGKKFSKTSQ